MPLRRARELGMALARRTVPGRQGGLLSHGLTMVMGAAPTPCLAHVPSSFLGAVSHWRLEGAVVDLTVGFLARLPAPCCCQGLAQGCDGRILEPTQTCPVPAMRRGGLMDV